MPGEAKGRGHQPRPLNTLSPSTRSSYPSATTDNDASARPGAGHQPLAGVGGGSYGPLEAVGQWREVLDSGDELIVFAYRRAVIR